MIDFRGDATIKPTMIDHESLQRNKNGTGIRREEEWNKKKSPHLATMAAVSSGGDLLRVVG